MGCEKYFIITDFGSSSIKTFLIDTKGTIKATSKKIFFPEYSGPKVEYNSFKLLDIYKSSLKEVLNSVPSSDILSYGISCQRSSFLIWDRYSGKPLTPIISWQDGRAEILSKKFEMPSGKIHEITGLYKTPYYSAFKIKYLMAFDRELKKSILEKKALIGPIASYVLWHISDGRLFVSDSTLAQRMLLFNIKKMVWDKKLLELFEIPYECLPTLIPSFPQNINFKIYNLNISFSCLIGDQQAAVLPFIENKNAVINYGTGAFLLAGTGQNILKVKGLLNSVAYNADGKTYYLLESTVNSCGTFLKWLSLKFNLNFKIEEVDDFVKRSKNRILIVPSIGGIGSPYWDYRTLTTFTGLVPDFEINDLVKGGLEGIAFLVAEGFKVMEDKVKINSIIASGGMANIDYLLKFQSDILGKEIIRLKSSEITALGIAWMLASLNSFDTSVWNIFKPEKIYKPEISGIERERLSKIWQIFLKNTRALYKHFTLV